MNFRRVNAALVIAFVITFLITFVITFEITFVIAFVITFVTTFVIVSVIAVYDGAANRWLAFEWRTGFMVRRDICGRIAMTSRDHWILPVLVQRQSSLEPPKESERHVFSRIELVLKDVRKPGKLCYVV